MLGKMLFKISAMAFSMLKLGTRRRERVFRKLKL